jgi:uncharacterized protein YdiU (UPF0061 family)
VGLTTVRVEAITLSSQRRCSIITCATSSVPRFGELNRSNITREAEKVRTLHLTDIEHVFLLLGAQVVGICNGGRKA